MKLRYILLVGLFLSLSVLAFSQDTLKIMQYNLLYYGKDIYDCDQTTNNIDDKNAALRTIIEYARPDIFCVNEMDASLSDVNYLMDNVLNINGVTHWQHANVDGSFSINMICFAPRLKASRPIEPLPEKTSTKFASTISNCKVLKKDSNTIVFELLVVLLLGSCKILPLNFPLIIFLVNFLLLFFIKCFHCSDNICLILLS